MSQPSLERAIESLAAGSNNDPFAVLGPHRLPSGKGVAIRAFHPAAARVEVVRPAGTEEMSRRHASGVFEAVLPDATLPLTYKLRVVYPDGSAHQADDPYRFAPVFSPYDAHLFGEGNLLQLWQRFGAHRM